MRKTRKKINLIGKTVLIPGDIYQVAGMWYKGIVASKTRGGWKVAFPPEEGTTQTIYETWEQSKIMKYIVPGHTTAADIDSGRVIEPIDSVFPLVVSCVRSRFRRLQIY